MMADFTQCPTTKEAVKKRQYLLSLGSSCMIILGLYICSFPEDHHEWASWSDRIAQASNMAVPKSGELSRYIHSLGAQIFILGLHFSDFAKKALSNRLFVWMGKRSFAVYLIHPLFIRTVLVWVMYGVIKLPNDYDDYGKPIPPGILVWYKGYWTTFAALSAFYIAVYVASAYWTRYVESWCSQVLDDLEVQMFTLKISQINRKALLPK